MRFNKWTIVFSAGIAGLLILAGVCLSGDFPAFIRWYMTLLLIGICFFPFSSILFRHFYDGGWIFSKTIGIAVAGYAVWAMCSAGILKFTSRRAIVVTVIIAGICWVLFMMKAEKKMPDINVVLGEELLFLAVFLMWTYFAAFRPEASGTEKFMDYGFMAAMDRSTELPAKDIWYGQKIINYYYGGQYYGVYLAKLAYVPVKQAYNLFRMTVAAFAFTLPFSLVCTMLRDRLKGLKGSTGWALAGGFAAGGAVSLAGNMHYVLYGLLGNVFRLTGYDTYWFPDSTRYIGYNPGTNDKCIHEFPSYSFVLGDVHAHMVNIMFVLTFAGIMYAWVCSVRKKAAVYGKASSVRKDTSIHEKMSMPRKDAVKRIVKMTINPYVIMASFLIGIFHWTNYWDFVIYFTVFLFCAVFADIIAWKKDAGKICLTLIPEIILAIIVSQVTALPFTMRFDTMVSGIGIAKNHTPFYQMAVLWGLPVCVFILLCARLIWESRHAFSAKEIPAGDHDAAGDHITAGDHDAARAHRISRTKETPDYGKTADIFAVVLGVCGVGLILIPELVYVRDIYEDGYSRANTMFKLTYQAYILFGLMMAYSFIRLAVYGRGLITKILSAFLAFLFCLTLGYFPYSVREWFGNVFDRSGYKGLDATAFLTNSYPEDAAAIRFLDESLEGQPIVLEAPGDSYSEYCRVSAMTGLPTVEGWYVHEWLWRGDTEDLNVKLNDIQTIYTSGSAEEVRALTDKYDIQYIFVGSCERAKYPDLNDDTLRSLGTVIYSEGGTYVVRL